MGFNLQPIVIAAIAAGGTAAFVLIITGTILIYRRCSRRPSSHSLRSADSSRRRSPEEGPSSSAGSSTRKSPNPYLTPVVPHVQAPPPPPIHHRRNGHGGSNQRLLANTTTPSSTPESVTYPYSPTYSHIEYTPQSIPILTPNTNMTKLRKMGYEPPVPPPHHRSTPRPPRHHILSSEIDDLSPPPTAGRTSSGSSIMLITYEQGLAKLGLTGISRPLPTAATMTTISSHASYIDSASTTARSPPNNHLPLPSPRSNYLGAASTRDSVPALPSIPTLSRIPSSLGSGDTRYRPQVISMVAGSSVSGRTSPIEIDRRRGSFPRTITPPMISRANSLGAGYKDHIILEQWDEEERAREAMPAAKNDRGEWLPSYYLPAADRFLADGEASKSRWGGKV